MTITRRRIVISGFVLSWTALAGCSRLQGGSAPCSAIKNELELLANHDFDEAAEYVPYEYIQGSSQQEAADFQRLQAGFLFGEQEATIQSFECTCEDELSTSDMDRVERAIERLIGPIDRNISKMYVIQYSISASVAGESHSESVYSVVYSLDDDGDWYTTRGRPATELAVRLSECR